MPPLVVWNELRPRPLRAANGRLAVALLWAALAAARATAGPHDTPQTGGPSPGPQPPSGVSAAVSAPALGEPGKTMDSETDAFLARWANAYQRAKTLSYVATCTYPARPGQTASKQILLRFRARRPNLLRIQVDTGDPRESALLVCDGRTAWQYGKVANQYYREPAPMGLLAVHGRIGALRYVPYSLMFRPEADKLLRAGLVHAATVGHEEVDGERCVVVLRRFAHRVSLCWCSERDFMPRRSIDYSVRDAEPVEVYREERRNVKVDKPISDKRFQFEIPKDARPYEAPDAIVRDLVLKPGIEAPELIGRDGNDKIVRLSALHGRPVLLAFWDRRYPSCLALMDVLTRIQSEHPAVSIVAVTVWDDPTNLKETAPLYPGLTLWRDPAADQGSSMAYTRFAVRGLPTAYLIDRRGKIAQSWPGFDAQMPALLRAAIASAEK